MAAEKNPCGRADFLNIFYSPYLVGAWKKYAQTRNTVVWYNIFNVITLFIEYYTCQKLPRPKRNIIHVVNMNSCFQNDQRS